MDQFHIASERLLHYTFGKQVLQFWFNAAMDSTVPKLGSHKTGQELHSNVALKTQFHASPLCWIKKKPMVKLAA